MYTLFNPNILGEPLAVIDCKGKIISIKKEYNRQALELLINQVKRGKASEQTKNLLAVAESGKPKDCKTLQQLFGKQNRTGNTANLGSIKPENRYRGRNWDDPELRAEILELHQSGLSIRQIADSIGVNSSTLTRANKRYKLYPERDCPITSESADLQVLPVGCTRENSIPLPKVLDVDSGVCKGGE